MLAKRFFSAVFLFTASISGYADEALLQQKSAQYFINDMVKHDKFSRNELVSALKMAKFQPQIIDSMERPYEKKPWDVYKALFLTPTRVAEGLQYWQQHAGTLAKAEKEYGVPAEMIVAILGIETQYGKRQGEYRVLDALTTLAFYYPKRSPYFTKELREYFLLCRERHLAPTQYMGSYAGAIGQPQFMPSSYRQFAVDFVGGQGRRDLVNDHHDVIGSVANYFKQHGWAAHGAIAQPAQISRSINASLVVNSKQANYPYHALLSAGVAPVSSLANPPSKVGLIELETDKGAEYWMAYPNFYVITRYNTSPQYALAAYLLANQLREQRVLVMKKQAHTYG
jgi:membrane-bound lytic murein transglycosylase B